MFEQHYRHNQALYTVMYCLNWLFVQIHGMMLALTLSNLQIAVVCGGNMFPKVRGDSSASEAFGFEFDRDHI